jgi:hypothetical protein
VCKEYFYEHSFRSFVSYMEHRFCCDFIKEFKFFLGYNDDEQNTESVSHSVA